MLPPNQRLYNRRYFGCQRHGGKSSCSLGTDNITAFDGPRTRKTKQTLKIRSLTVFDDLTFCSFPHTVPVHRSIRIPFVRQKNAGSPFLSADASVGFVFRCGLRRSLYDSQSTFVASTDRNRSFIRVRASVGRIKTYCRQDGVRFSDGHAN